MKTLDFWMEEATFYDKLTFITCGIKMNAIGKNE